MQEVKQSFPGNRINGFLSEMSKWLLGAIVLVSVLEWKTPPNTSLAVHFGIEGTYVPFLALLMVATLSYQHKAVFMKKADEDKVQFWKQISPYFIYARREVDVEDLSYYVKKKTVTMSTNDEVGPSNLGEKTVSTTYVYDGTKKIFVFGGECDFFRESLGKSPSRRPKRKKLLGFGLKSQ